MGVDPQWLMLVGARWLHFASLFALCGGPLVPRIAGWPAVLASRRWTMALRIAVPLAVASGLLWLAASLAGMAGGYAEALDPGFLRMFFLATPFGPIVAVRLLLFAALLASAPLPPRRFAAAAPLLAAALLVTQAWLGHAAEGASALMLVSYAAHVLAGAVWLGGMPALLLVLAADRRCGAEALSRFSGIAAAAALVVIATGAANTLFHAGDAGALLRSDYGRVLSFKLAFVAAMLAIAASTRFRTMPRLREGEASRPAVAITVELCAGLTVLFAAAVLGITAPPR